MSGHLCVSAKKNCYAIMWSYGEICCHSNCCGQFGKGLKMWRARLRYHRHNLKESKAFDNWADDKDLKKLQQRNKKLNIKYNQQKIKKCEERIEYFKGKK